MDIKQYDVGVAAEAGSLMELKHPTTGDIIRDAEGSPVGIFLKGMDSATYRAKDRELTAQRLNNVRRKGADVVTESADFDTNDRDEAELFAAITVKFTDNFEFDGEKPSPATSAKLYRTQIWITEQAKAFIRKRSNFLKS